MGPDSVAAYNAISGSQPDAVSAEFPDGGYCVMRDGLDITDDYLLVDCGDRLIVRRARPR